MAWRVTQYDADSHHAIHSEVFPWKPYALFVAWVMGGRGFGGRKYYTSIEEVP